MEATSAEGLGRIQWKYRAFSDLLALDDSLLMVRRFSALTARVLLYLQDGLSHDEEKLKKLEMELSSRNAEDIHNGLFRQEIQLKRMDLVKEIDSKLRKYSMSGCS